MRTVSITRSSRPLSWVKEEESQPSCSNTLSGRRSASTWSERRGDPPPKMPSRPPNKQRETLRKANCTRLKLCILLYTIRLARILSAGKFSGSKLTVLRCRSTSDSIRQFSAQSSCSRIVRDCPVNLALVDLSKEDRARTQWCDGTFPFSSNVAYEFGVLDCSGFG